MIYVRYFLSGLLVSITSVVFSQGVSSGQRAEAQAKVLLCSGCHGIDGNSSQGNYPHLAGQRQAYLLKQLQDFRQGKRHDETMSSIAEGIDKADLNDIAWYFSQQKLKVNSQKQTQKKEALSKQGALIYQQGIASAGVSACLSCHGRNAKGLADKFSPRLAGQQEEYIEKALNDFAKQIRKNDLHKAMREIASKLTKQQIKALASYLSTVKR